MVSTGFSFAAAQNVLLLPLTGYHQFKSTQIACDHPFSITTCACRLVNIIRRAAVSKPLQSRFISDQERKRLFNSIKLNVTYNWLFTGAATTIYSLVVVNFNVVWVGSSVVTFYTNIFLLSHEEVSSEVLGKHCFKNTGSWTFFLDNTNLFFLLIFFLLPGICCTDVLSCLQY